MTAVAPDGLLHALEAERAARAEVEAQLASARAELAVVGAIARAAPHERTLEGLADLVGDVVTEQTGWRLHGLLIVEDEELPPPAEGGVVIPIRLGGVVAVALEFAPPAEGGAVDLAEVADAVAAEVSRAAEHARTELRLQQAEQRHRTLVEQLPLATYADRPDRLTGAAFVSPQIEALTGYAVAEWLENPDLFPTILHPDDRDRVLADLGRLKRGETDRIDQEYRIVRPDGSLVWLHDVAVNVRDDRGRVEYAQGYVHDISARKERDEMLEYENERLREVERLKDDLISLVSHELRTPLTSVVGYVDLIVEDDLESRDDTLAYLEVVKRNAERLQRLVGDLLFCAQMDAGRFSILEEPLALGVVLTDAMAAARPAAEAAGVTLELDLPELPQLNGDRARLAQVVDNLVSNAIKFTPGGGTVTVRAAEADGEVRVEVSDTGIGIPASEQEALCTRFFRTSTATQRAIQGTGLGLSITKAIVEAHGGTLCFTSVEGEGTTFAFTLPVG